MAYHLRSPLAKVLFEKIQHQNEYSNTAHEEWYSIRIKYLSNAILEKFIQFNQDEETKQFIEECFTKSDWFFTQIYHGFAKSILTWFVSATSANGYILIYISTHIGYYHLMVVYNFKYFRLLNRGSMFVLSKAQIKQLLQLNEDAKLDRLLDLGAGDGKITLQFRPFFNALLATEVSSAMQWRLRQKQIELLEVDSWTDYSGQFDVIACLNLLDRCDRPISMLKEIRRKLRAPTGLLLLGLVFPIRQYVENNPDHKAAEMMPLAATRIWEVQLNHFVRDVIEPAGYQLIRWTRVPYLCEGDFSQSFYLLNDVVLVLQPRSDRSD